MKKALSGLAVFTFFVLLCIVPCTGSAFNQEDLQKLNTTNSCPKCDLSGANLAGIDMYGSNLVGADLTGADLSRSSFGDADLRDANLKDANIKETSFAGAKLSNAIWPDGKKCKSGSIGRCK